MSSGCAASLERRGYARDFLIMNGNGGMISARFVTRESAKTVMSGPASGVIAAAYTGKRAGYENLVTYDMGGTSTDVALIRNAEPAVSNETEIEYAMPIHVPMVAVHTVGAGGGSIARVDASGLIQVGPESAGANPGPICYGRGGTEPTITDANLLLGRLDPKRLLAVDAPVTVEHVRAIFAERIGKAGRARRDRRGRRGAAARQHEDGRRDPHGLGERAATIRAISRCSPSAARGRCMRRRWRANSACRRCWCRRGRASPMRSAASSPISGTISSTRVNQPVALLDEASVRAVLERHREEGAALIAKEAVTPDDDPHHPLGRHAVRRPDAYTERAAAVARGRPRNAAKPVREGLFRALQGRAAGDPRQPRQPQHVGHRRAPGGRPVAADRSGRTRRDARRRAARDHGRSGIDGRWLDTPVYAREKLPLDAGNRGPAILEQMDATTVLEPGDRAARDADGNIIIEIGSA